jgi:cytochrome oxidase Cu insertion factor (SCO1/SenC/PrrC family)
MKHCRIWAGILLLAAAPLLWAHGDETHETGSPNALAALIPKGPVAIDVKPFADDDRARNYFTDLPLRTQEGKPVRFYSDVLRGRVVLINFIYTNCDQGCPVITRQLTEVKDQLGERFGREVFFVSISTDPERDSPEAMQAFAKEQGADHPGWIFLTGEKRYVDQIITKLGQYSPVPEEHSSLLLAGNVQTRHWMKIRPNSPIPAITYKLNELADESNESVAEP